MYYLSRRCQLSAALLGRIRDLTGSYAIAFIISGARTVFRIVLSSGCRLLRLVFFFSQCRPSKPFSVCCFVVPCSDANSSPRTAAVPKVVCLRSQLFTTLLRQRPDGGQSRIEVAILVRLLVPTNAGNARPYPCPSSLLPPPSLVPYSSRIITCLSSCYASFSGLLSS